jgi:hypothetical protein
MTSEAAPQESGSKRETDSGTRAPASLPTTRWFAGLILAAILGWVATEYPPVEYTLPDRLTAGTVANSPELQAEANAMEMENNRKSAMMILGLIGIAFGTVPVLFCFISSPKRLVIGIPVGIVIGAVCGVIAALLAIMAKQQFGEVDPAAIEEPSMYGDIAIFGAMSVMLAIPAATVLLIGKVAEMTQKLVALPLAGLVTALAMPIIASFLFPKIKTDSIPPAGPWFSLTWLLVLALLIGLLTSMTGGKRSKA